MSPSRLVGFDPVLSAVDFSFKVGCESKFDCQPDHTCPDEPVTEPRIDYLAKDYNSFRSLMLDRLSDAHARLAGAQSRRTWA